jgi:hypothetical protein
MGIVAVVLGFVPLVNIVGLVLGIVALVLGLIAAARSRARQARAGTAITGAVLGGAAVLLSVVMTVVYTVLGISALLDSAGPVDSPTPVASEPSPPVAEPDDGGIILGEASWGEPVIGENDAVVPLDLVGEPAVFTFSCPECEGSVTVESDGASSTLVDGEGPWQGEYLLDIDAEGAPTTELSVSATGLWTVTVDELSSIDPTSDATGYDEDAVVYFPQSFDSALIGHMGDGAFSVVATTDGTSTTVVDTMGPFSETVELTGPCYVQVFADDEWSIVLTDPVS